MKHRILAVDDEAMPWLENFRAWIPSELAEQDSAATTSRAIDLLRRRRYDVVLLDLSMDISDSLDRSNRGLQEYLASKPEGTQYIIVSAVIEKTEVRDSAFHLNAFDIIFKAEVDPAVLREKVAAAIERSERNEAGFVVEAKGKLTQMGKLDGSILEALHPSEGATSLYRILDGLFKRIVPIASHRDRPHFVILGQHVFALVWSRLLGKAVSIVMSSTKTSEDQSVAELGGWVGYSDRGRKLFGREAGRVRLCVFEEPDITDLHFDLPLSHAD